MISNLSLNSSRREGFFTGVDPIAIMLYLAIVFVGCLSIASATYDSSSTEIFSLSHFYMRQASWAVISFIVAIVILLTDASQIHKYSYLLYFMGVGLLILALLFGREVNGAKSWFELGPMRLQPVELVKISTSLAMARVMSEMNFSIKNIKSLQRIAGVILLPIAVIILQNDTGSGIVFGSFLFVLYREDLNKWICIPAILIAALFILSFVITPLILLLISLTMSIFCNAMIYGDWRQHIIYYAVILMLSMVVSFISLAFMSEPFSFYISLLIASLFTIPWALWFSYMKVRAQSLLLIGLYIFSMIFLPVSNYIFDYILRDHQQNRIMSFLGIVNDPLGIDYNVNQSKIAIGSGGLLGKGFLNGTQVKYGFVPERHTDFIFCDVAEEWGFVGAAVLLSLMMMLIYRLMWMGERQAESFGRIYCYCVASILLFHTYVNIGMTIGLMPVMGIPLPFMSYGGSSLLAFTIMVFIAFRFDASTTRGEAY